MNVQPISLENLVALRNHMEPATIERREIGGISFWTGVLPDRLQVTLVQTLTDECAILSPPHRALRFPGGC